MFTNPNPLDMACSADVVWCISLLADVTNERSFPSSAPSIKCLLPHQSFTRGLISMKSMLLLVPALQLQTATSHLGLCTYLLSTSSSPSPPLPPIFSFMFPFSSLPRCLRVFVFSLFLLSSQDRWEQTAWQFSSPFYPLSCFPCVAALSIPLSLPLCFLQIELKENLDLPFWRREVSFGAFFLPTDTQPHGFGLL